LRHNLIVLSIMPSYFNVDLASVGGWVLRHHFVCPPEQSRLGVDLASVGGWVLRQLYRSRSSTQ